MILQDLAKILDMGFVSFCRSIDLLLRFQRVSVSLFLILRIYVSHHCLQELGQLGLFHVIAVIEVNMRRTGKL